MSDHNHPETINRDYIRLLQVMRRFVREEFSVSIRMTQDDAIELLLHYAGQSRNPVLQEMAKELRSFTRNEPVQEPAERAQSGVRLRYYRGAAIPMETEPRASEDVAPRKPSTGGGKRIYRGRVVD